MMIMIIIIIMMMMMITMMTRMLTASLYKTSIMHYHSRASQHLIYLLLPMHPLV